MNIFESAVSLKKESDSKARKNSASSLSSTITVPYFKGLYRKGDCVSVKAHVKKKAVEMKVKPLTGAFLISYFTCLAYCECKAENQPLTVFVVQAFLTHEGFSLSDYAQGKTAGAKRVATHLKAVSEQRGLPLKVTSEGIIEGLTDEVVNSVISNI